MLMVIFTRLSVVVAFICLAEIPVEGHQLAIAERIRPGMQAAELSYKARLLRVKESCSRE